jgi:ATP-dependent Clp protease adaptor protein ClpS
VPDGGDLVVLERLAQKIEPPQMYQVAMLNDDYTPMDFVVMVLTGIFALSLDAAVQVMLTAHQHGEALVTVLPYHEASERVYEAHALAQSNGYPLRFYLEPDGSN